MTTVERTPDDAPSPRRDPEASGDQRQKLGQFLAVVAGLIALAVVTGNLGVAVFVISLIAIVMLHEFGHFFAAKRTGMKVTEYFLGFGPRLWSVRRGETEYGIKAIPAGGYVKILGMNNLEKDVDPADEPRTYRQQPYWARVVVVAAGIFTQFVVAFLLLMVLWAVVGVPNGNKQTIAQVVADGPADRGGFRPGDRVVSVDGRTGWDRIRPYLRDHPGQPLQFVVERDGKPVTLDVTPASENPDHEKVGYLGVETRATAEKANPIVAAGRSGKMLAEASWLSLKGLGSFFSPSSLSSYADLLAGNEPKKADAATPGASANENRPLSLVGVGRLAGQAADSGAFHFISLLALLNIFIAVLNLVPLLPLDGGHIAIATYERIRSRHGRRYHADAAKMMPVAAAVLAILVLLGVTSLYLDIANPIPNPF